MRFSLGTPPSLRAEGASTPPLLLFINYSVSEICKAEHSSGIIHIQLNQTVALTMTCLCNQKLNRPGARTIHPGVTSTPYEPQIFANP